MPSVWALGLSSRQSPTFAGFAAFHKTAMRSARYKLLKYLQLLRGQLRVHLRNARGGAAGMRKALDITSSNWSP